MVASKLALRAEGIEHAYGDRIVLKGADVSVYDGERVGLVGHNGSGKTTLLRVLCGDLEPDRGEVRSVGRLAMLQQVPDLGFQTVGDAARDALSGHYERMAAYERALEAGELERAGELQAILDRDGWEVEHRVDAVLARVGAPEAGRSIGGLSGGELRRVALARALLASPDVLVLDEPTNHLDLGAIEWLQACLMGWRGAVLLVTHDRYLLEAVATRIVEVEEGRCVSYDGSYGDYVVARAERFERHRKADARRRQIIAREAAWAARSPAARTTKQAARLKRLDALRAEEGGARDATMAALDLSVGIHRGATLLEADGLTKQIAGRTLFEDVGLHLRPGDRFAVVGPNGCGKSTLLRVLAESLAPDAGSLVRAKRVKIGVVDQARTGLDPDATVLEAAGDGAPEVQLGQRWVTVQSFLQRILFRREQFTQRVAGLSGGERARLLLARLVLKGSVVLLLDEPTNDLDLMTLRVLEEALLSFDGAVVVVTHDRAFVDRVCTGVLAFEGTGVVPYADRAQWDAARRALAKPPVKVTKPAPPPEPAKQESSRARLSWKEQRELEALPERIEALEAERESLEGVLADPATYRSRAGEVAELTTRLQALSSDIEEAYTRWTALEERA